MGQLVVLGFDGITAADEVLNKVRSLKAQHLIDLEDAVVVERDADGKVHVKQAVNLTRLGATSGGLSGAFWGMLVGLLFLNPAAGLAPGAGRGGGGGAGARGGGGGGLGGGQGRPPHQPPPPPPRAAPRPPPPQRRGPLRLAHGLRRQR
jgi:hypothetical protein